MIPPAIMAAILTIVVGIATGVIGFLWRRLQRERRHRAELETRVDDLESRTKTVWDWAYGRESDETDSGIASDVESGFAEVKCRLDELDERIRTLEKMMRNEEA